MPKIVIYGNSGSGKSTLAKNLAEKYRAAHLDLDTIAWKSDQPGNREDFKTSVEKLNRFISEQENWIIEDCYSNL